MTTKPTIPAAIIEKAAAAKFYRAHPEYPAGENHWENVAESYRQVFRDSVARTLAPVYADIQAEALRDEHHTMDELYEYRMAYNAIAANAMPELCVKSWRHSNGEFCFGGGWFIVTMNLPTGQVSNHYREEHWDLFRVPVTACPPSWDGHTPDVALARLIEFARADELDGGQP